MDDFAAHIEKTFCKQGRALFPACSERYVEPAIAPPCNPVERRMSGEQHRKCMSSH
ncbi:hypothetical protein GWA01_07300 [Gluconobacter wancherniae NBRC 103581]|uniref:Uncharacterized protein n=1 Tax=Gluconobacter wancherniae NBRC 103581 TaxID=656744 RepID=A0A511AXM6_9PROT|nr:hypothetical protein AA103581_0726 [Gluconobacter wancherniae NBRC 103581]GEK92960.1 hypothetical protein GWA01_07300 [Gluconobacter wancherniae NBRC 103581]